MRRYRPSTNASGHASDEDFAATPKHSQASALGDGGVPANGREGSQQRETASAYDSREAALRSELASVQRINTVIEGVVASLVHAKANMATVSRTVQQASTLLDSWTRILSQTEHNQRLILNPAWQGATRDIADAEGAAVARQREKEQREAEEVQRRRAAEEKRRVDEERRVHEAATPGRRPISGRGRAARGPVAASASRYGTTAGGHVYNGVGGQGGHGAGRGAMSRVTRGTNTSSRGVVARGRARNTTT